MEVMSIRLIDDDSQLRVITDTQNMHLDRGFDWGNKIGELDGYPEAAKEIRNHLLGVVASIDWQKIIERTPHILNEK